MTRSLNVLPKTTEQHLIVHSDKSVITNNKRLRSTLCTIEANYWQTRSIAQPLCDSRATCWSHFRERSSAGHKCYHFPMSAMISVKVQLWKRSRLWDRSQMSHPQGVWRRCSYLHTIKACKLYKVCRGVGLCIILRNRILYKVAVMSVVLV